MTNKKIIIIILILTLLDIATTQYIFNIIKAEFPDINYWEVESNPIMRLLMSALGVIYAYIVKLLITLGICAVIHFELIAYKYRVLVMIALLAVVVNNFITILFGMR